MDETLGAPYERLFEAAPSAILIADESGRVVFANIAMSRLLGRDAGELLGREIETVLPPSSVDERGHPRLDRGEGNELPVEAMVSEVETERGTMRITALRDISADLETERERQNLEIRLKRATGGEAIDAQLGQTGRLETVGQLAGGIAHDFNNILGVIINYSQFVIDELERGPRCAPTSRRSGAPPAAAPRSRGSSRSSAATSRSRSSR